MPPRSTSEIRQAYLDFFKEKGHVVIKGAPLVPENDPTVLFTTAGMHPLVPYLLGETHPAGKRLVDVQRCIRTQDIDEVGDASHLTCFEMLGNWSLGDYFKKEAIEFSFEFLTSKKWLGIPVEKLAVTCFEGDKDASKDEESASIWQNVGIPVDRIGFLPKKDNWWGPAGQTGPCGPDTEMFYWRGEGEPHGNPSVNPEDWMEIWNDVFMQYNKKSDGTFEPLKQKNVDTGMGLERVAAVMQGVDSVYDTDAFKTIMQAVKVQQQVTSLSVAEQERHCRIIVDHLKAATFIIADGVHPSNVDRGYVLRRLIRRAIRSARVLGIRHEGMFCILVSEFVIDTYKNAYSFLIEKQTEIHEILRQEEMQFARTLYEGLKQFNRASKTEFICRNCKQSSPSPIQFGNKHSYETSTLQGNLMQCPKCGKLVPMNKEDLVLKIEKLDGQTAFHLYDTYGFPFELTKEIANEMGISVDEDGFHRAFKAHQALSRAGAEQKFKGGLADNSAETTKLHTATHLLNAALRRVLGTHIQQKGSNITQERLRFDFNHPEKMTPEQIKEAERLVNEAIKADLPMAYHLTTVEGAKKEGAIGVFDDRYGAEVKVYQVGDGTFSKEICGGPHVARTGMIGSFTIQKEESSSSGVRRIKAVVSGGPKEIAVAGEGKK